MSIQNTAQIITGAVDEERIRCADICRELKLLYRSDQHHEALDAAIEAIEEQPQ